MTAPVERLPASGTREENVSAAVFVAKATDFLDGVYRLEDTGQTRMAVERVVGYLDDLLNEGDFAGCDEIFSRADVTKLTPPVLIAFLGTTVAAKKQIGSRENFCAGKESTGRTTSGRTSRTASEQIRLRVWIPLGSNYPETKRVILRSPSG